MHLISKPFFSKSHFVLYNHCWTVSHHKISGRGDTIGINIGIGSRPTEERVNAEDLECLIKI